MQNMKDLYHFYFYNSSFFLLFIVINTKFFFKYKEIIKGQFFRSIQGQISSNTSGNKLCFFINVPPILRIHYNCFQTSKKSGMSIWNFSTQGQNYHKFRPNYPNELYCDAIDPIPYKKSYLDIGVGTGKTMFTFSDSFSQIKGVDISDQMLQTAKVNSEQYMAKNPNTTIVLEKKSVYELNEEERYDLITAGVSLHYFPGEDPMRKISTMLNEGGMFLVLSYNYSRIECEDERTDSYFQQFWNKMIPYFAFEYNDLHSVFADAQRYPFDKYFSKVERKKQEVKVKMTREELIVSLKTLAAYNIYYQATRDDATKGLAENSPQIVYLVYNHERIRCFK